MERHPWQVWLIGAIGLWLILSPFVLGVPFAEEAGAGAFRWTFVAAGSIVTMLAIGALPTSHTWEAGLAAAMGAWLVLSPWLVGFTTSQAAIWSAIVPGTAIVALGIWSMMIDRFGHAR